MSSAKACFSVSSVIALPPYFTTIVLPWYCFSHGSALGERGGLGGRLLPGGVDVGVVACVIGSRQLE